MQLCRLTKGRLTSPSGACSPSPGMLGASKASREIQTRPQLTNLKYQKIKSLGLVDDLVF